MEATAKTPAGLRAGRYELLARLAAGGMGEVFIARQTGSGQFEKRVALKLLLPHLSQEPEFIHMFLDEARIAARMNHPNIVQIFDLGEAEGRYFIAMGLVEGASLARLLSACRARKLLLPIPILRAIAGGLCAGLQYAHDLRGPRGEAMGVVHRDVNPANVLISTAGAVLLTDFGIAKAEDNLHRTRPGDVKGKYAYMAPEQMKSGAPIDARVDVFAAAVTLFEAATLVCPFARATDPETIDAIRGAALPDPQALRPDLPAAIARALRKGAAKNAIDRIPSVRELRDALMDGPVAAPEELGEWVEKLCGEDLAIFRGSVAAAAIQEVGTRSLVQPTPSRIEEPPPRRRSGLFAALALAVALASAGLTFSLTRHPPEPANAPAPVEAERPGPAPAPVAAAAPAPEAAPEAPTPPPLAHHSAKRPRPAVDPKPRPKDDAVHVGYLSADASPWAAIYIEGEEVDRTPLSRYPLTVGEHLLVFKNPDLGKEISRKVAIEEGKVATVRVDFGQ